MRSEKRLVVVALVVLVGAALLGMAGCTSPDASKDRYHCPMHPAVTSDKPGDCPICGMRLVPIGKPGAPSTPPTQETSRAVPPEAKRIMYRSTMSPSEVSDHPGKDSMGMEMVPFEAEPRKTQGLIGLASVGIPPERAAQLNLALSPVERRPLAKEVRAFARIVPNEARLYRVTTKVEGWVDRLYVDVTGQAVRKGQPLLTLYSPALVASQQELLSALDAAKQMSKSPYPSVSQGGRDLIDAARRRLRLWDISEAQIDRIEKTGQVEKDLTVYSPAGGYVTEKTVLPGQKVAPGDSLLVVADLSVVWAEAEVYESDLPYVKVGMPLKVVVSYWPGKVFTGKINFLNPFLDPASRTLKARMDIANPELLLKPEMYGDAYLSSDLGPRIAVPESAVMRTGDKSFAFVEKNGSLVPVEIAIGARSAGYYEVLSGLGEGDRVVTSANFLVDSESSLKAALQAVAAEGKK